LPSVSFTTVTWGAAEEEEAGVVTAARGEAVAVEVMVAVGETAGGASGKWHPDTKESSLDFARECVCTHYLPSM
jgi:hypothetical protein